MAKKLTALLFGLLLSGVAARATAAEELYAPPKAAEVRTQTLTWVASQGVTDKAVLEEIGKLWAFGDETPKPATLLDTAIQSFALADAKTKKLVDAWNLGIAPILPIEATLPDGKSENEFYLANLRLYYARYLTQLRLFEEALNVFEQIDVNRVVDPASCLFFQAVCEHGLLKKKEGLATLNKLLKNTEDVPVRYSTVATLMQYDLQALREKSLGEVARKMSDVERRLDLGRGGQKVQKVEEEIIASLDEIIKKLEQQMGGGGGGGSGSGGQQNQSSSAAKDSSVKGSTAPGNVDQRNIGNQSGWGALPPKQETQAKNLINRNFPAHYRQAIEQYFKKLANRRARPGK